MRNLQNNLRVVDLMIVEEIPEVEIVAVADEVVMGIVEVDSVGKMVNVEAMDVAENADPVVVVEAVMEIAAVGPIGKMVNVEAVAVAENAGPEVAVVDAPVIAEVAGGAKAVAEVAADEAGVAEAKPSSLIV